MSFALFYNTDTSFLYPTIQSILSLRTYVPQSDLKPYVAVVHGPDFDIKTLDRVAMDLGTVFISVDASKIGIDPQGGWSDIRIPAVTLLKFYIADILPGCVRKILYIDPDTLFTGEPRRLFDFQPRAGAIGAVEDALAFYAGDWSANGRSARAYMQSLGLGAVDGYFNAGLLLFDRETWAELSSDALRYFSSNSGRCIHFDQSALNAVASRRKQALSPVWNYQTRFRFWGDTGRLEPNILHFTGAGKAWLGPMEPWRDVYGQLLSLEPRIEGYGFERPCARPTDVEEHNARIRNVRQALRRRVDYRLRVRRARLIRMHLDAAC